MNTDHYVLACILVLFSLALIALITGALNLTWHSPPGFDRTVQLFLGSCLLLALLISIFYAFYLFWSKYS
jgi:Zn-dependent protease with chaperone function